MQDYLNEATLKCKGKYITWIQYTLLFTEPKQNKTNQNHKIHSIDHLWPFFKSTLLLCSTASCCPIHSGFMPYFFQLIGDKPWYLQSYSVGDTMVYHNGMATVLCSCPTTSPISILVVAQPLAVPYIVIMALS